MNGATPQPKDKPAGKDNVSEIFLAAIATATRMGMITFPAESSRAIHNVRPIRNNHGVQTGTGSGVHFRDHNEAAFADRRPDAICLYCIRGHKDAATTVSPVGQAVARLSSKEIELLRSPVFSVGVPKSFAHLDYGPATVGGVAAIYGSASSPLSRVNFASMMAGRGAPEGAERALRAFEDALRAVRQYHYLQPGSALIINNKSATHGRSAFEPLDFGASARWLQRTYLRTTRPSAKEKPSVIGFGW